MSNIRNTEDLLREEYFRILPLIEHAYVHAEAFVLNALLPFRDSQTAYGRMEVRHRIKACESAINSLRRRQEGGIFEDNKEEVYTLLNLHDLVGFRILVFPKQLVEEVKKHISKNISNWKGDHIFSDDGEDRLFMYKYYGLFPENMKIYVEIQIMPMLAGLFSDVEHDALYKPKEEFKGIQKSYEMRRLKNKVLSTLDEFEVAYEKIISEKK